ncbi:MAG: M20/M25/M40 family metallo-hydrolase, partial [Caldilinea sp.]|nr:M20/M25/M40 family metallo-hydrolase [Caldilinea sp.]
DFWNWLSDYVAQFNAGREKAFDQLLPSLRRLATFTDDAMHDHAVAGAGIRLPLDFDADRFAAEMYAWAAERAGQAEGERGREGEGEPAEASNAQLPPISNLQSPNLPISIVPEFPTEATFRGPLTTITLRLSSYEPAWRGGRSNPLVRSFLAALREVDPGEKLGFVLKTGTSDMNVVGPAWECPIVAYGPGDSSLDHTPHEHVPLDDYWRAV